jgi:hypothetical protein
MTTDPTARSTRPSRGSPDLSRLVTLVDHGQLPSVLDRTCAVADAADASHVPTAPSSAGSPAPFG